MKYTDLIFDLYGTLVDIHTEEDALVWEKTALYFGYYGAHYSPAGLKEAFEEELKNRKAKAGQSYECFPDLPFEPIMAQLFRRAGVQENADTLLSFDEFAEILGVRREQVQACIYWLMRHKNIDIERLRKNISKLEMIETTGQGKKKVSRTYVKAYSAHVTDKVENLFHFIVEVYNEGYAEKKQIKNDDALYAEVVASRIKASYGKMENLV